MIRVTTNKVTKKKPFPKLMSTGSLIVLFVAENQGTVIKESGIYEIGHHSTSWDSLIFTDYNELVTMQNE